MSPCPLGFSTTGTGTKPEISEILKESQLLAGVLHFCHFSLDLRKSRVHTQAERGQLRPSPAGGRRSRGQPQVFVTRAGRRLMADTTTRAERADRSRTMRALVGAAALAAFGVCSLPAVAQVKAPAKNHLKAPSHAQAPSGADTQADQLNAQWLKQHS